MSVMIEPLIRALTLIRPLTCLAEPGKIIMGLRVVGTSGSRLGFWRSLRRVIGYFISAFALHLGILWVIVNKEHHSRADKLAGSSVVYAWHARPDAMFLPDQSD
jgi:uncharacterized RDD family membrane protein YckC